MKHQFDKSNPWRSVSAYAGRSGRGTWVVGIHAFRDDGSSVDWALDLADDARSKWGALKALRSSRGSELVTTDRSVRFETRDVDSFELMVGTFTAYHEDALRWVDQRRR